MDEHKINLLVIEKTEELHEKRATRSFWRSTIATLIILPVAYFGLQALAEGAAKSAAKEALDNQKNAWSVVFSSIAEDAQRASIEAESAVGSARIAANEASNAKNKAEESSKKLEEASSNISATLGFSNKTEVINSLLATSQVQSAIANSSTLRVGSCVELQGSCGTGMFKQPTYYFDRVSFGCPTNKPLLNKFRFTRCGNINSESEGLAVVATCCALTK
jgi:hypothetical protein